MQALYDRGISEETIRYFGIEEKTIQGKPGWQYPVPDAQGQIVGWRWKNADSSATPKYLWLPGARPELYNLIGLAGRKSMWIVNGEPSVWAMHTAGTQAVCWFGEGSIPANLLDLLTGIERVFYAPDHDIAGYKAALKVMNFFSDQTTIELRVYDLEGIAHNQRGFDMNDLWKGADCNTEKFKVLLKALPTLSLETIERRVKVAAKPHLPAPPRDKRLNPLLGNALERYAVAHGKTNPDGSIGILSPDSHRHDEPGKHCTYYPDQMAAWEYSKDRWIPAKELCTVWGINYEGLGGIYEKPAKNGKKPTKRSESQTFTEAEGAVLACLFQQEAHWSGLTLTPESFSKPVYRDVLNAMRGLRETGTPINLITLKAALQQRGVFEDAGGDHFLRDLDTFRDGDNIAPYLAIVKESALKRQVQLVLYEAVEGLNSTEGKAVDVIDTLMRKIENYRGFVAQSDHLTTLSTAALNTIEIIAEDLENHTNYRCLKTGLQPFDDLVGGLFRGRSYIGIALSGIGKSNFLGTVAMQLAQPRLSEGFYGYRGLIFSLEMSAEELAQRFIAQQSGVSAFKQDTRHLQVHENAEFDEFQKVSRAATEIALWGDNLIVNDNPIMNAKMLREIAYSVHKNTPLDFIGYDYIQLSQVDNGDKDAKAYGEISYTLKCLARELDIATIGLAQVNREGEKGAEKPMSSHVRDSGEIVNHANVAFFIYRPGVFKPNIPTGQTVITVVKNRGGSIGTCNLWFDGVRSRFYSQKPEEEKPKLKSFWGKD